MGELEEDEAEKELRGGEKRIIIGKAETAYRWADFWLTLGSYSQLILPTSKSKTRQNLEDTIR
jgi:hypothetical protein